MIRRVSLLVVLVALVLMGRTAAADDSHAKRKRTATVLLKQGVEMLQQGRYDDALNLFQAAHDNFPSSKILLNIGTTYVALKRPADAANAYARYLQAPDPGRREEVQQILAGLDTKVGRLRVRTDGAEGELHLDGAPVAAWSDGMVLRVMPGQRVLALVVRGATAVEQNVVAAAGRELAVDLRTAKPVAPKDPPSDPARPDPEVGAVTTPEPTRVATVTEPVDPEDARADAAISSARPAAPRLAALALAHVDYKVRGVGGFVGASFAVSDRLAVIGGGLIGGAAGAYLGGSFSLLDGAIQPRLSAGVPLFFSDGARIAIRGAGGVSWKALTRFALIGELAVEHYFDPEFTHKPTIVVPTIGIQASL